MSKRVQFKIEYPLESSAAKLYEYISTDYGLAKWFANKVHFNEKDKVFTCEWDDLTLHLELVKKLKNQKITFYIQENGNRNDYFQLAIERNPITDDISLVITDFVLPEEKEDFDLLWNNQLAILKEEIESDDLNKELTLEDPNDFE